jgi:hypothetical protein
MSSELRLSMSTTLPNTGTGTWPVLPAPVVSPAQVRSEKWMAWIESVRAALLRAPGQGAFFTHHWATHSPGLFTVQPSAAMSWTLDSLRQSAAAAIEVEVQAGRLGDGEYESRSHHHRKRMPFKDFLDLVESGPANDVYMTANNSAANVALLGALADDLRPLPPLLRPDPKQGFLWIGRDTLTPMHHDLTQNVLIQLVGTKVIRLVSPVEQRKLGNTLHVFADFHWLDEALATARNISFTEVTLTPGKALFVPVGWWHCVRAAGFSVTYTSTNFLWANDWVEGFP